MRVILVSWSTVGVTKAAVSKMWGQDTGPRARGYWAGQRAVLGWATGSGAPRHALSTATSHLVISILSPPGEVPGRYTDPHKDPIKCAEGCINRYHIHRKRLT